MSEQVSAHESRQWLIELRKEQWPLKQILNTSVLWQVEFFLEFLHFLSRYHPPIPLLLLLPRISHSQGINCFCWTYHQLGSRRSQPEGFSLSHTPFQTINNQSGRSSLSSSVSLRGSPVDFPSRFNWDCSSGQTLGNPMFCLVFSVNIKPSRTLNF